MSSKNRRPTISRRHPELVEGPPVRLDTCPLPEFTEPYFASLGRKHDSILAAWEAQLDRLDASYERAMSDLVDRVIVETLLEPNDRYINRVAWGLIVFAVTFAAWQFFLR